MHFKITKLMRKIEMLRRRNGLLADKQAKSTLRETKIFSVINRATWKTVDHWLLGH
ncbi:MAG: hypothetical protein ACI82A_002159 [Candidatus Azotimanducaceae bacterium]|jgi:hypothetical protein